MATEIGKATVPVTFDADKAIADAKAQLVPAVGKIAALAASAFAAKKIFDFAKSGLAEFENAAKVAAQTTAALKSTGGAANVTGEQIAALAGKLEHLSGTDDEVIQAGENMLLTFKAVRNEVGEGNQVFDRATAAALDLSTAGFGSMESASVMLGKALNDPIAGITALQRAGVTFTAAQKETIKSLVESGNALEAQKIILKEVESQVGGSAAAFGKTLPGQIAIARQSLDDMKGEMVAGLAPALQVGAKAVTFLTKGFAKLPEPVQAVAGSMLVLVGGILSLARPVNEAITLINRFRKAEEVATVATEALTVAEGQQAVANTELAATSVAAGSGVSGLHAAAGLALNPVTLLAAAVIGLHLGLEKLPDDARSFTDLAPGLAALGGDMDDTGRAALLFKEATHGASEAVGSLRASQLDEVSASQLQDQWLTRQASHYDQLTAAIDRQQSRLRELNDGVTTLLESQLDYAAAQRDTVTAVDAAAKATDDLKTPINEIEVASDAAKQAIIDQGLAAVAQYDAMAGSAATAQGEIATQKAELEHLRDTLAPGSPLIAFIDGYIAKLKAIPTDISTEVRITQSTHVTGGFAHGGGAFAHGGVEHADRATTAVFGEAGGETAIFIPDNPASRLGPGLADLAGLLGDGGGVHIEGGVHIHANSEEEGRAAWRGVEQEIAKRTLRAESRALGSVPR